MENRLGEPLASGRERYAVNIEYEASLQARLQGVGLGPMTGQMEKVEVEYDGDIVTEVPAGEYFNLKITYHASNPGAGAAQPWRISFTAKATDGSVKGREHADIYKSSIPNGTVDRISGLYPMPSHDITIRVKMWGNQTLVEGFSPPESEW